MTVDSFPGPQMPKPSVNLVLTLRSTNPYLLQPLKTFLLKYICCSDNQQILQYYFLLKDNWLIMAGTKVYIQYWGMQKFCTVTVVPQDRIIHHRVTEKQLLKCCTECCTEGKGSMRTRLDKSKWLFSVVQWNRWLQGSNNHNVTTTIKLLQHLGRPFSEVSGQGEDFQQQVLRSCSKERKGQQQYFALVHGTRIKIVIRR